MASLFHYFSPWVHKHKEPTQSDILDAADSLIGSLKMGTISHLS